MPVPPRDTGDAVAPATPSPTAPSPLSAPFSPGLRAPTSESEIGQLLSRAPRLITTLRKVPPGTDGAISLPGTLAGVTAACLATILALALSLLDTPTTALLIALAAFLGTVADSLIGARFPRIGNETTNVICTLVAATLAPILT